MPRMLSVVIATALVTTTGFALLQVFMQDQPGRLVAVVCGVALVLSTFAAILAVRSTLATRQLSRSMDRLVVSVDAALRERPASAAARSAIPHERAVDPITEAATPIELPPSPPGSNVVQLASVPRTPRGRPAASRADEQAWREALVASTSEAGAEISLQPIFSASSGEAKAFEVHRMLFREHATPINTRRIVDPPTGFDLAAFDLQTLIAAFETSRRQLSGAGVALPLHVTISDAFLASRETLDRAVGLLRQYPELAEGIVLTLQVPWLKRSSRYAPSVQRLQRAGYAVAAEADGVIPGDLGAAGLSCVRIPSSKLIERKKVRAASAGNLVLDSARRLNVPIVAAEVANDEDALAMLDLGVDLMVGERFSAPRRLKSTS